MSSSPAPILPRRAAVRPRVVVNSSEWLLEECVAERLARRQFDPIVLQGPPGSGKSTALAHLLAIFGDAVGVGDDVPAPPGRLAVRTVPSRDAREIRCTLKPWDQDDLIEYSLSKHRGQCKTIMARVAAAPEISALDGSPALLAPLLDAFATDENLTSVRHFLRQLLEELACCDQGQEVAEMCMRIASSGTATCNLPEKVFPSVRSAWLLSHRFPVVLLASEGIVAELATSPATPVLDGSVRSSERGALLSTLQRRLPTSLMVEAGLLVAENPVARLTLERFVREVPAFQPTGASLLLCANRQWRPTSPLTNLCGAVVSNAQWDQIDLQECVLLETVLAGASLRQAKLVKIQAFKANFRGAKLREALMDECAAGGADFSGADLSGLRANRAMLAGARFKRAQLCLARLRDVDLRNADLRGADLTGACLTNAQLSDARVLAADFTDAHLTGAQARGVIFRRVRLRGANFRMARLLECDFSGLRCSRVIFTEADLTGSLFTGSRMRKADFEGAILRNAGLAEVDWEGANLRDADFANASFHLGSSRSGLVQSTIASEGTRTGFYTDDFDQKDYKPPEEIRRANLCRCDLRGAKVDKTDFYLVDLRDAIYSGEQAEHFRRCGAILYARA